MDAFIPIIIIVFAIASVIKTAKQKTRQENEMPDKSDSNVNKNADPEIAQLFGYKDTLSFFEQQFAQEKNVETSAEEGQPYIPYEIQTASLENQDVAAVPLTIEQITVQPDKTASITPSVYVYETNAYTEHDYEATLKETAINPAFMNLFSNKNEITRAIIYSEVLKPKFKRM